MTARDRRGRRRRAARRAGRLDHPRARGAHARRARAVVGAVAGRGARRPLPRPGRRRRGGGRRRRRAGAAPARRGRPGGALRRRQRRARARLGRRGVRARPAGRGRRARRGLRPPAALHAPGRPRPPAAARPSRARPPRSCGPRRPRPAPWSSSSATCGARTLVLPDAVHPTALGQAVIAERAAWSLRAAGIPVPGSPLALADPDRSARARARWHARSARLLGQDLRRRALEAAGRRRA